MCVKMLISFLVMDTVEIFVSKLFSLALLFKLSNYVLSMISPPKQYDVNMDRIINIVIPIKKQE